MTIDQVVDQAWARKHDDPASPVQPNAPLTMYPTSLEHLIEICTKHKPDERLRAVGSHWALSEAAISDSTFVETHDPNNAHQALGRTLYDAVPGCLSTEFILALKDRHPLPYDQRQSQENEGLYPVHFETGKRVYQLYAELDYGYDDEPRSLARLLSDNYGNPDYLGPWAFPTLGGAAGQTVFGALTTGTHGADFRFRAPSSPDHLPFPPIADAVMALHLVVDGGKHYWVEPESPTPLGPRLTDDDKLRALFGPLGNFEVRRDDTLFNAILVSAGRFGIVYSIVLATVRQYSLFEERSLTTWQNVRPMVNDTHSPLYDGRFLQVGICLTPHDNFTKNLCGVMRRWNVPLAPRPGSAEPLGRAERRGAIQNFDPMIQARRFEFAGNSTVYNPDPQRPDTVLQPDMFTLACADAGFLVGYLESVVDDLTKTVAGAGAAVGGGAFVVGTAAAIVGGEAAAAAATALAAMVPFLIIILAALLAFLLALKALLAGGGRPRFGETLNDLKDELLNRADPKEREAGIFVWQSIAYKIFKSQQDNRNFAAISYAVMDQTQYFDKSCFINVDSIEVFFDASDKMLPVYIDLLTKFEIAQEFEGKAFVGYVSLRFTGPTRALLGMQRYPLTCAVEIAGLKDVTGTKELIDYAIALAHNGTFNGILHWGQRHESTRVQVQERFGDTPNNPTGPLHAWRNALGSVTHHGKLNAFSSAFSRRAGLEIVTPLIAVLEILPAVSPIGQPFTVRWDCEANPPTTTLRLDMVSPSGVQAPFGPLALKGQQEVIGDVAGVYTARLTAAIDVGGERREAVEAVNVVVA